MVEKSWSVFPGPDGHPAKLAWALKEALTARGFSVARALRTEWGYRIELSGMELTLAEHPTEPGLLLIQLKPRGVLDLLARARFTRVADAVEGFLKDRPELRLETTG